MAATCNDAAALRLGASALAIGLGALAVGVPATLLGVHERGTAWWALLGQHAGFIEDRFAAVFVHAHGTPGAAASVGLVVTGVALAVMPLGRAADGLGLALMALGMVAFLWQSALNYRARHKRRLGPGLVRDSASVGERPVPNDRRVDPAGRRSAQERSMATPASIDEIYAALGHVIDPELGVDIVTLGLVYDVSFVEGKVDVTFTLTTRGCPLEYAIHRGILATLTPLPGVREVAPRLVWSPPWDPRRVKDGVF